MGRFHVIYGGLVYTDSKKIVFYLVFPTADFLPSMQLLKGN